jgi:hypothetical protein
MKCRALKYEYFTFSYARFVEIVGEIAGMENYGSRVENEGPLNNFTPITQTRNSHVIL